MNKTMRPDHYPSRGSLPQLAWANIAELRHLFDGMVIVKHAPHSLWLLLFLSACQTGGQDPNPPTSTTTMLAPGPAASIGLISTARLAFTEDQGAFRGGYLTHDVRVADGIIDITPKT